MDIKKEIVIACCAAAALFVIGVVCYAAFPDKQPGDRPHRIMFQSTAGKVLFSHTFHSTKENYGLDCLDCHRYWDKKKRDKPISCNSTDCHSIEEAIEKRPKRSDALHDRCMGCHKDTGHGPGHLPNECNICHVLKPV